METEGWVMLMSKSILNMVGQEVGQWNRWPISEIGEALFSEFTGQVIGIKEGTPLPVTMATPSACSELWDQASYL